MGDRLKLYVWEGVLYDYRAGIMFAYARSIDEARIRIAGKMGYEHDDLRIEPREVIESEGFYVHGST